MKKTILKAISLLLVTSAMAAAHADQYQVVLDNRAGFAALSIVVFGNMLSSDGQKFVGNLYFNSKDRVCMRVGAIQETAKDLQKYANNSEQHNLADSKGSAKNQIYSANSHKAQSLLEAAVLAATYCGGNPDGSDDQHFGVVFSNRTISTAAELQSAIDIIEVLANQLKGSYDSLAARP